MTSLLSVVMPTRNRAEAAMRAAASVLAQNVDLELVVVNDHSEDDTADRFQRLTERDRRVRLICAEAGDALGPCLARNLGLDHAEGDLVSFCDDDDAWTSGIGQVVLDYLAAHPDVVMASSWHTVAHVDLGTEAMFRGPTSYGFRELLWQNVVAVPFGVIRRNGVPFPVSFDPQLPTGEDWDLWLRCAEHGRVTTIPHVGYVYAQHGGSRVTRGVDAQIAGRQGFLAKHGNAMTASCRLYHEAVVASYERGRQGVVASLGVAARHAPARAAAVGALLAMSAAASRIGQRRRDPGLQARFLTTFIGRQEVRH